MKSTFGFRNDLAVTQLLFFFVIWLIFSLANAFLMPHIAELFAIHDIKDFLANFSENTSAENRYKLKYIQSITHFLSYTVPSLIFVFLIHKKEAIPFLELHRSPKAIEINMTTLMIVTAFPIAQLLLQLNQLIPLSESAIELEEQAKNLTQALLVMDTPTELIFTLITLALLPAIGEELMFRGIIQKYLTRKNVHQGIIFTAIIFSALHFQFAGFIPRFFLGVVLGYLFYWSGSLWLPIIAHFLNNGIQVLAVYFYNLKGNEVMVEDTPSLPWYIYFVAIILFSGITYWFVKRRG